MMFFTIHLFHTPAASFRKFFMHWRLNFGDRDSRWEVDTQTDWPVDKESRIKATPVHRKFREVRVSSACRRFCFLQCIRISLLYFHFDFGFLSRARDSMRHYVGPFVCRSVGWLSVPPSIKWRFPARAVFAKLSLPINTRQIVSGNGPHFGEKMLSSINMKYDLLPFSLFGGVLSEHPSL